jgi:hypothetical protein
MHRNKLDQIVDDYYADAEIIDTNPESKYFGDDHNAQQLERIFDECVDSGMSYDEAEEEAIRIFQEQGI